MAPNRQYLDATDYKMGTDEEWTEPHGTVGSGLTRTFIDDEEREEDTGTREQS